MAQTLKSIGFEKIDLEPEIHVQNIVASADLKTDLNLNAIALDLGLENIRVRAGAVSWTGLPDQGPKGGIANIQFWQASRHRWQVARRVRRGGQDSEDAAGKYGIAVLEFEIGRPQVHI